MKRHIGLLMTVLLLLAFVLPTAAQEESELLPLIERGDYHVGARNLTFVDEERDGRSIRVWLWYPGMVPEGQEAEMERLEQQHFPMRDLAPDRSGAPYPVVLVSTRYSGYAGEANSIFEPLASHGFVVAYVEHPDRRSAMTFVDAPLDILFTLDRLAALNRDAEDDLSDVLDVEKVGVVGADLGADASLMVSGARVDPVAVNAFLEQFGTIHRYYWRDWDWAAMTAHHDRFMPAADEGALWSPMTDPRIRAVVAVVPCNSWIVGSRGADAATVPTFIVADSELVDICAYENAAYAYIETGAADRYLLTFTHTRGDLWQPTNEYAPIVRHFLTSFFGYYLQGNEENTQYLTKNYAESLPDVMWGVDETALADPQYISALTFDEMGTIDIGDSVTGEIVSSDGRVGYYLALETPSTLNIFANAAGRRTSGSGRYFNPVFYVIDEAGEVLFWNDEIDFSDNLRGRFDAGLEGIALPAGNYTIVVDGYGHETGPYELIVNPAE